MVVDDNPEETAKRVQQQRELMLLSRPNNVSRAYERVPRPKEGLPTNPLPLWNLMPLDHKIPAVPAPPDTFIITQGELSNGIFYQRQRHCFDIDDPYIRETPIEYDPLHDPHLKEHFQHNPLIVKKLIKLGMLTAKGNVRCTLAQLNKYRVYLKRLYNCLINADRANEQTWRTQQLDQIKEIRKCTLKIIKEKWNEELRRRRMKSREERELRNMLLKKRREEHPSNFIHETRAQEAAHRKYRNDQKRYKVYYRLSAMRKADQKRRKMILLHIMCQEDLTQKIREYLCEERSVNRAADLATFIRDKRKYQEDKLRYHRALLQREDIEKACKIVNRQAEYDLQDLRRREAAAKKVQKAKDRKSREWYLMVKYGKKWMLYVRRARLDAGHASVWHVRNLIRETGKELKLVSGAKSFTSFLRDIMEQKNKELFEGFDMPPPIKFDTDTRRTVKEILDVLVDCSYKEFVRRATSCLVDHVVNEAREKCVSYICRKGFDPGELVAPIIPRRLRNQIRLEPPTHPCSGPCAQFGKSDAWKRKCGEMCDTLGQLHDELSDRLSKKLTDDLQKILDDENALDTMQKKVMDARGSAEMEAAADTVAGIAMDRASTRPANKRMQKEFTDYASDRLGESVSKEDYDRAQRYLDGTGLQSQLEKAQAKQKELRKGLGRVAFEGLEPEDDGFGSTIDSAGPSGAGETSASGKTDTTADGAENLLADSDLGRLSSAIIADLLSDSNEMDGADELMGAVDAVIVSQKNLLQRESLAQITPLVQPSPSTLAAAQIAKPTPSTAAATKPQPSPSTLAAAQPTPSSIAAASAAEPAKPTPSSIAAAAAAEPAKTTPSSIAAASAAESAKPTPSSIAAARAAESAKPTPSSIAAKSEAAKPVPSSAAAPSGLVKPSPSTASVPPSSVVITSPTEPVQAAGAPEAVKPSPSTAAAAQAARGPEAVKPSPSTPAVAQAAVAPEAVEPSPSSIAAAQAVAETEAAKPSPSTLAAAQAAAEPEAVKPSPSTLAPAQAAVAPQAVEPSPSSIAAAQAAAEPEAAKPSPSTLAAAQAAAGTEAVKPSPSTLAAASPAEAKASPSTIAAAQAASADQAAKPTPSSVASAEPSPFPADVGAKAADDTTPKAAPETETALTPSQQKLAEASKAEDAAEASAASPVTSQVDVKGTESQAKAAIPDENAEKPEATDEPTTSQAQKSPSTTEVPASAEEAKPTEAEKAVTEDQGPEAAEAAITEDKGPEPTPSQIEAAATPSQIQAAQTPSQIQAAQTPSQIQAAAAPSTAKLPDDQKPLEESVAPTAAGPSDSKAEAGPAPTESQKKLLHDEAAAVEATPAGAAAEETPVATTPSGTPILDGTGKAEEAVTAQDSEAAGPSLVEPTASQAPLKEPSSHPPSQTPSQALAAAQAQAATDGAQPDEAQQAQVIGGAEGEGVAETPSGTSQVVPTDSKAAAESGKAGEGESPEAAAAAVGGEQKNVVPGTVSKSASQMVTTAICSACDKETKLLDGTQAPLQVTESERFGKVAEDMAEQAIQKVLDGKVVCDDDKAPEAGSALLPKESDQVSQDAEYMTNRAIQNVLDGKVVCDDELDQGQVLSSTSSVYGIDDISKVGSLITTEAIEAAKLRCGPKLAKAGRVDDGDGVSLAASELTNEAVEAAKNLASDGGQKSKGMDPTAVPQDGDANLDGDASALIHGAIYTAMALVQGEAEAGTSQPPGGTTGEGIQVLVPPGPGFDTQQSLAPTRQSSQLGVSISTVPSRIGSTTLYSAADSGQIDRLASDLAIKVLEKCAPDQEVLSKAVPSRSYVSIFDESDLSRQASIIADTAVTTAKDKEEGTGKMNVGDSALPAVPVPAVPARPPSRKPQPYTEPPAGQTALVDPEENDLIESGEVTESGVEMILYPQMLPPESELRIEVTPSDINRMVYQINDDDESLMDVNFFRFGGRALGKSDIHLDRTTFPSAIGGPHGLAQHMAEPLGRSEGQQLRDGQPPPPIPPRQGEQRRLGPQTTLTPDVRAHVHAQLLSIRTELADITQALISSGVMQPRGTPTPQQPPPREP